MRLNDAALAAPAMARTAVAARGKNFIVAEAVDEIPRMNQSEKLRVLMRKQEERTSIESLINESA